MNHLASYGHHVACKVIFQEVVPSGFFRSELEYDFSAPFGVKMKRVDML